MTDSTRILLEQHFDTAFAAPDGIARLRELILTLAMQGKLVEQDPNDPPASELLKEIKAEKRLLVKAGKIKKPKPLPPIKPEEVPYHLPQGWEWVRLGEAMLKITDGTHHSPPNSETGDFLYISAKNIKDDGVLISNATYVTEDIHEKIFSRCDPEYGDILYIKDGATTGIVTINDLKEPFSMLSSVALLKQPQQVDNRYLLFTLRSPFFYREMRAGMTGVAITRVTLKKLHDAIIPLPRLPEQHRIVARIDQLMARCDTLEKLRKEQEEKRLAVHAAAVKQLLDTPDLSVGQTDGTAWDFIHQHFGELYTVKENVAELRKAILQLAVMGRLVPQDSNDPPASELLKEIEAEKQRLVKAGKIKKPKPLEPIKPEEVPYELPLGWEWVRLGNTIAYMDAGWSPKCESEPARDNNWGVLKTTAVQTLQFWPHENKALPGKLAPRPDAQVEENDILITRAGPKNRVGICCVAKPVRPQLMLPDKIIRFKIYGDLIFPDYCALALSTGYGADQIERMKSGMADSQMNISQEKVKQVIVALPPLPEQHRIVARIDQLMALCDTLDQQIDAATGKQAELLGAVMAGLHHSGRGGQCGHGVQERACPN